MPRRFPDVGRHYDRRVQTYNVVPSVDKVVPPSALYIVFEFDAQRAEIEKSVEAAVDFRRAVNESSALAKALNCNHMRIYKF